MNFSSFNDKFQRKFNHSYKKFKRHEEINHFEDLRCLGNIVRRVLLVHLSLNNFMHFKTSFHSSLPKLKNNFLLLKWVNMHFISKP